MEDDSELENWVFIDQNDCVEGNSTPEVSDQESDGSVSIINANTHLKKHAPVKEIIPSEADSEDLSQTTSKIILEEQESDDSISILSAYSEEEPAANEELMVYSTSIEDISLATSKVVLEEQESDSSISILSNYSEEEPAAIKKGPRESISQTSSKVDLNESPPDKETEDRDLLPVSQPLWSPDKSALEVCGRTCHFRGSRELILKPIPSERTAETDRTEKPQSAANDPSLSIVIFAVPMLMCMLVMLAVCPSYDFKTDRSLPPKYSRSLPPTHSSPEDDLNRYTENVNSRTRFLLDNITKDLHFKRHLNACTGYYGKRYEKMCTILFIIQKMDDREYYWMMDELMRNDQSFWDKFFAGLDPTKDASSQKRKSYKKNPLLAFKTTVSFLRKLKTTFKKYDIERIGFLSKDTRNACQKMFSKYIDGNKSNRKPSSNENRPSKYCRLVGDSLKDVRKLYRKLSSIDIDNGYENKRETKLPSSGNLYLKYSQADDSFKLVNIAELPMEDSALIKNGSRPVNGKWYFSLYGDSRSDFRRKEEAAEWYFKRAQYRKRQRNDVKWHFDYISNRDKKNSWTNSKRN